MAGGAEARPVRVTDAAGAGRLVAEAIEAAGALEAALAAETAHVRAGRVREGLSGEAAKAALAARYMTGTEILKANAIALARFAPTMIPGLKEAHRRLAAAVETNQTVLATARAVSESLVKGLSDELGRGARPQTYGAAPTRSPYGASAGGPLVLSRSL